MLDRYNSKETFWQDYLRWHCKEILIQAINDYPEGGNPIVSFEEIQKIRPIEANQIILEPKEWMEAANRALQTVIREEGFLSIVPLDSMKLNLVGLPEVCNTPINSLRAVDRGRLVVVEGQIRSVREREEFLQFGAFKCSKCDDHTKILQKTTTIKQPNRCAGCGAKGPFELDPKESIYNNIQEVLLQEQIESITSGQSPKNICLRLAEEHIDSLAPGDRATITGIYTGEHEKQNRTIRTWIEVTELKKKGDDILLFKPDSEFLRRAQEFASNEPIQEILEAACGEIYGRNLEKTAILFSIIGGVRRIIGGGKIRRGDIHIILMGDPGTAKSQCMRMLSRICPRFMFSNGGGASKAGLTAAIIKDEFGKGGGFAAEAGVLVLSNGGTAFIDEFDKMNKDDRASIHPAMEQQVFDISKAGVKATFVSRCSVVAAANPEDGKFDLTQPLAEQFNLPPALLSRFDLVITVLDKKNKEADEALANHQMELELGEAKKVDLDFIKKYVAYAKRLEPKITRPAALVCKDYYQTIRSAGENVNVRQLEGLYRLSEAHAKLHLRQEVLEVDARFAIGLHREMIRLIGYDPVSGDMDLGNLSGLGHTLNQEGRIKAILASIRELSKGKPYALIQDVVDRMKTLGLSEETTLKTIRFLEDRTKLYRPGGGHTVAVL